MCSIFGAICFGVMANHPRWVDAFTHSWNLSSKRGKDSWGQTFVSIPSGEVVRRTSHHAVLETAPNASFQMLGQRRGEPTTEWVHDKTDSDVGPYLSPSGRWLFTHNGVIANDREIGWDAGIEKDNWPTQIDSYAIGIALDAYGWDETVRLKLSGSFALLAIDLTSTRSVIKYATNYKPLFVRNFVGESFVLVASQREFLDFSMRSHTTLASDSITEVQPYTMGEISPHGVFQGRSLAPVTKMVSHVAVVCSGGLDSSVVAWYYHKRKHEVTLIHYRYGCKAELEEERAVLELAKRIREDGGRCNVVRIPLDFFKTHTSSVLTDIDGKVNRDRDGVEGAEIAHEWVPARNLIMMSLAMGWCESNGVYKLALGTNLEEGGAYPDNEPEFLNKLQALVPYALRPYHPLTIETPIASFMKHEIVKLGLKFGMPFEVTWSCYEGVRSSDDDGSATEHCGSCGPCSMRRTAFAINHAVDPAFDVIDVVEGHGTGQIIGILGVYGTVEAPDTVSHSE